MCDSNAFVTRYAKRESRYPVPSRPYPARPALYRETRGVSLHHGVQFLDARKSADGMMR